MNSVLFPPDAQTDFEQWMADGNVNQLPDGSYSTQDAQWRNRLADINELKMYYMKEFDVPFDYGKVGNIVFEDVDHSDAPDYCDAHIISAEYDGVEMTEEQIELLNNDSDFVYDSLISSLY